VFDRGLTLNAPQTLVSGYSLSYPNGTALVLETDIDFAAHGLNGNQGNIGDYFNRLLLAGGSGELAALTAYFFGITDIDELRQGYDQLSPEAFLAQTSSTLFSSLKMSDSLHSCEQRDGDNRFIAEGDCLWLRLDYDRLKRDKDHDYFGFKRDSYRLAGGIQRNIAPNWFLGFGLAYESDDIDTRTETHIGAKSNGQQGQGGIILKRQFGATMLAADISGGFGWYDSKRYLNLLAANTRAKSDQKLHFAAGHLRLSHAFEPGPSWYIEPSIDTGVTWVHNDSFNESGAGVLNLDVDSSSETFWSARPAIEAGTEFDLKEGRRLRLYGKLGVTHFFSGTDPKVQARLQGVPASVSGFTVATDLDKNIGDVEVGITLLQVNDMVFKLG
jgi:outer membrane autotransporter protein